MKGKSRLSEKSRQWIMLILAIFNILLFCFSITVLFSQRSSYVSVIDLNSAPISDQGQGSFGISNLPSKSKVEANSIPAEDIKQLPDCTDKIWCSIPMPKNSFFKFEPPTNKFRWRLAQIQAANGEQVLLRRIVKFFPNHFDFIDGDITFRKLHYVFDIFIDERRDLSQILMQPETVKEPETSRRLSTFNDTSSNPSRRRRLSKGEITAPQLVRGRLMYPWELQGRKVVPEPYEFRYADRAPVVSIGYTAYSRDSQTYFAGNNLGGAFLDRHKFFQQWRKFKDRFICNINIMYISSMEVCRWECILIYVCL